MTRKVTFTLAACVATIFLSISCLTEDIEGSTGFIALSSPLYNEPIYDSASSVILEDGQPFRITQDLDNWWQVQTEDNQIGYLPISICLINLPDILPDILYDITNAYSSIYQSSGVDLDITGTKLYKQGKVWNQRLDREEYIIPIKYSFAKIIEQVQSKAIESGYCLKIYDGYRPSSVSATLRNSLYALYNTNETVRHNIDYDPQGNLWGQGWFLAQNVSSHNLGVAIDVTLVNNTTKEECKMPTPMHELSTSAVKFTTPDISPYSYDNYSNSMTNDAKLLNEFFILSGARGLSSEWWHFQDQEGLNELKAYLPNGMNWEPTKILSIK